MNDNYSYAIEAEEFDLQDYGEDLDDFFNESADSEYDDWAGEDYYYSEMPEDAEARHSSAYYRARAARAKAARAARARAARTTRDHRSRRHGMNTRPPRSRRYYPQPARGPASTRQVDKGFQRVGADIQKTQHVLRKVDLESKVQADTLAGALAAQRKRMAGGEYAFASSLVVNELKSQFPEILGNKVIQTALPLAPLLFLRPPKKGNGVDSLLQDPRILAALLAAGIALFKTSTKDKEVEKVTVNPPVQKISITGGASPFIATARDHNGEKIDGHGFNWFSSDPTIATVDSNGLVTPVAPGKTDILAIENATETRGNASVVITPAMVE